MTMKELLGLQPQAPAISRYISSLAEAANTSNPKTTAPEIKSYTDAVYFNYYSLGISLLFAPINGYKPMTGLKLGDLNQEDLVLDSIDLYNVPKADESNKPKSRSELAFATFPISPIIVSTTTQSQDKDGKIQGPSSVDVTTGFTGKDFIQAFGEPDRKGGGTGPSSGSISIWCEWSKDGIMVEFGGAQAKGPHAWDTGKDAAWKVITLFRPRTKSI